MVAYKKILPVGFFMNEIFVLYSFHERNRAGRSGELGGEKLRVT